MSINDQLIIEEQKLAKITQERIDAEASYKHAFACYCNSEGGSGAQEDRRERLLHSAEQRKYEAQQAEESQLRLIETLKKQQHE